MYPWHATRNSFGFIPAKLQVLTTRHHTNLGPISLRPRESLSCRPHSHPYFHSCQVCCSQPPPARPRKRHSPNLGATRLANVTPVDTTPTLMFQKQTQNKYNYE